VIFKFLLGNFSLIFLSHSTSCLLHEKHQRAPAHVWKYVAASLKVEVPNPISIGECLKSQSRHKSSDDDKWASSSSKANPLYAPDTRQTISKVVTVFLSFVTKIHKISVKL